MWALLRIWHVEVLSSVADKPNAHMFARTSYCVAPETWKQLSPDELGRRAGVLLDAAYAKRNHQMAQTQDPTPMWLVAYDQEWVAPDEMPALSPAQDALVVGNPNITPALVERAVADIDGLRGQARPGVKAKAWADAFSAWSVEANGETWNLLKYSDREPVFSERLG